MPVYKRCPFCDAVFEIDSTDETPLRRHLRFGHVESGDEDAPAWVG